MNKYSKIINYNNISPLFLNNINKRGFLTINKFKLPISSTRQFQINQQQQQQKCFIRLYTTESSTQQQQQKDQLPHPGVTPPSLSNVDLKKYLVDEKLSDLNPDHLVYQSNKETLLRYLRPALSLQAAFCISAPLIAYFNQLQTKTVLLLSVFSLWGVSFKFIGEKLGSFFAMRVYREPGSDYIKLVHVNPSLNILKIPIEDIQESKVNEKKVPFVLLDNGAIFFFENGGVLHKPDDFNYILSGEANKIKHKKIEQEEYDKFFEDSTKQDLENANRVLDFELELIEKKIEEAKREKEEIEAKEEKEENKK